MELTYEVVLEPSEEGGFAIYVPALRGCISQGETEEEAMENIKDAIQVWLDTRAELEAEESEKIHRTVVVSR